MKKPIKAVIAVALALFCCASIVFANRITSTSFLFWNVSENTIRRARTTFSIEPGESIEIRCVYSPRLADVDFGLIDSDNRFHYITSSQTSINCTITIDGGGDYCFAVRNPSTHMISVTGFIDY